MVNNVNKEGNPIKNKKKLRQKIQNRYDDIKNLTKDLRNKAALYLTTEYDNIMIPEFKTQNMVIKE